MACSRIIGSKRLAMADAATKIAIVPSTRRVAIPASQYFLRLVTRSYPSLWMVLGKDCFANLCEERLLIRTQKEAICHPSDVIADHAVNGPMFQGFQVVFRQFLRMSAVEFKQLRDHRG